MKRLLAVLLSAFLTLSLGALAFADTLTLPKSVNTIGEEAFMGDTSLDKVMISEGVAAIPSKAFYGSSLKAILLPAGITSIADDAFTGCSDLTFYAQNDYAYNYAAQKGFAAVRTDDPVVITAQPQDAAPNAGETAAFSVAAVFAESWKWQYSDDGGTSWTDCADPGSTTDTLTVTAKDTMNGRQYRCTVANAFGSAVSDAAVLKVGIPIDADHFPDDNFRAFVGQYDTSHDGYLSDHELAAVTEMTMEQNGVSSLTGIEYFSSLTKLTCTLNNMTEMDLGENQALTTLDLHYNRNLSKLTLSGGTPLKWLDCSGCGFSVLNLAGITTLEHLSCNSMMNLSSLVLTGCTALSYLDCENAGLPTLDLTGCTALSYLDCSANSMTSLTLDGCTSLTTMFCGQNDLPGLDLTNFYTLSKLDCYGAGANPLVLSGCTGLRELYCGHNQLESLDVSDCSFLEALNCIDNQLDSLDISPCFVISDLNCMNNNISELDLTWCLNLKDAYQNGTQSQTWRNTYTWTSASGTLTVDDTVTIKTS